MREKNKTFSCLCFLSPFYNYLSHNHVTHWMESPEQIIFFLKSLFPVRKPTAMHFHPLQALLYHEGAQGGRPALYIQWMILRDHSGNNKVFQSTKNRAGPCATRRVLLRTLVQGCSSGPSWCRNRAALLGRSLRSPPLSFSPIPEELLIPLSACSFRFGLGIYHFV